MSDHHHYDYADSRHDHRGDYAEDRHDHDNDYAGRFHRHYDEERDIEKAQRRITELQDDLDRLRDDFRDALNRIHELENNQATWPG